MQRLVDGTRAILLALTLMTVTATAATAAGGCSCEAGTLNGARWCDNADGTVTDLNSCLVWLKDASCVGAALWTELGDGSVGAHSLASQLKDGSTAYPPSAPAGDCGLTDGSAEGDWRLPTKSELGALLSSPEEVRLATPRAFSNLPSHVGIFFWSSTSYKGNSGDAWMVSVINGGVTVNNKTTSRFVWPVRAGK